MNLLESLHVTQRRFTGIQWLLLAFSQLRRKLFRSFKSSSNEYCVKTNKQVASNSLNVVSAGAVYENSQMRFLPVARLRNTHFSSDQELIDRVSMFTNREQIFAEEFV